jgi:hypothetical protein
VFLENALCVRLECRIYEDRNKCYFLTSECELYIAPKIRMPVKKEEIK